MPMQIVFPILMVGVGVGGAAGLVMVSNKTLYHKVRFGRTDWIFVDSKTRDVRRIRRRPLGTRQMGASTKRNQ